ncbi:hypothetical protein [Nocardioides panzhihuensis]|uniref:DUF3592 domain-containing protein n=1 Tax=Nocardioides panzhihuensis TaxID=860243 RepID=A0A7Z0DSG2_9ACTN|nr:hypothetical protein [Nocardioides panzhihuensis]NYI80798.1 hypothetical protein [Nocardioides panzhihuensis]
MKWVLTAAGFFIAMIAIFIGVVWFLFTREGPDTSHLTKLHSAQALELQDTGSAYNVVYEYSYGGETFYGSTSIQSRNMSVGSTFGICVDPDDPAQHAQTKTDCGPDGPRNPQEGLKEKPEL